MDESFPSADLDKGYILVACGTHGYEKLVNVITRLDYDKVVIQTGRVGYKKYKERRPNWIFFDFDPDFAKWLSGASLVISHFGQTVIDAALTYRKPVIIVPNPKWVLGATLRDAEALAKKLRIKMIIKPTPQKLKKAIEESFDKKPRYYPSGAPIAAKVIEEIANS